MLPEAFVRLPPARSTTSTSSVVVVFPFVPVIATMGHSQKPVGQLELSQERRPGLAQRPDQRDLRVDARAEHAEVEAGGGGRIPAQLHRRAPAAQVLGARGHGGARARVVANGHLGAPVQEKIGRFHAANSQSEHHDPFSV